MTEPRTSPVIVTGTGGAAGVAVVRALAARRLTDTRALTHTRRLTDTCPGAEARQRVQTRGRPRRPRGRQQPWRRRAVPATPARAAAGRARDGGPARDTGRDRGPHHGSRDDVLPARARRRRARPHPPARMRPTGPDPDEEP